eukprot:5667907-Pyramimonas_sp.AAC.1
MVTVLKLGHGSDPSVLGRQLGPSLMTLSSRPTDGMFLPPCPREADGGVCFVRRVLSMRRPVAASLWTLALPGLR